ncbi:hypothetical protein E2C01_092009 [Portunus trituberculatus]|uniref:Uncharacterized protein n=1 Tax=Portunus trituberculatus TaxID=210409 RepID=A0A5B7JQL3_PORTR|nr:hypothetical protein [Portunus trituberculatus]
MPANISILWLWRERGQGEGR